MYLDEAKISKWNSGVRKLRKTQSFSLQRKNRDTVNTVSQQQWLMSCSIHKTVIVTKRWECGIVGVMQINWLHVEVIPMRYFDRTFVVELVWICMKCCFRGFFSPQGLFGIPRKVLRWKNVVFKNTEIWHQILLLQLKSWQYGLQKSQCIQVHIRSIWDNDACGACFKPKRTNCCLKT